MHSQTDRILFVIALDQERNRVTVTPVNPNSRPGISHELWLLPREGAPISLGVLPDDASAAMSDTLPLSSNAALAVSVEYSGDPGRTPTCDLGFRKALLYAAELRGHRRVT